MEDVVDLEQKFGYAQELPRVSALPLDLKLPSHGGDGPFG